MPCLSQFCAINALHAQVARDFVGRLMADPGFVQKLVMEASFAGAASLFYEYRARGDKLATELDLAMINTLGMAAATAATVWMLAPSRSYGSFHKFPWQQVSLHGHLHPHPHDQSACLIQSIWICMGKEMRCTCFLSLLLSQSHQPRQQHVSKELTKVRFWGMAA